MPKEKPTVNLAACEGLKEYEKKQLAALIIASLLHPESIHDLGLSLLNLAKDKDEAGMKEGCPRQLNPEAE
jgi:hypothetical protein